MKRWGRRQQSETPHVSVHHTACVILFCALPLMMCSAVSTTADSSFVSSFSEMRQSDVWTSNFVSPWPCKVPRRYAGNWC